VRSQFVLALVETMLCDAEIGDQLLVLKGGGYSHRVAVGAGGSRLTSLYNVTLKIYDATPLPEKP
jgi:hypothetical protein